MIADDIETFLFAIEFERGMSANTCTGYASDLRFFAKWLRSIGRNSAGEITRDDIASFLRQERDAGMKGSTRARRTAAIRMWLKYLKERHMIRVNPSELMDPPKREVVLPRVLSELEVAAMLDAVKDDSPRDLRDRAMLEVMYGCGLRVSELCDLKMDAFVAEGELLRVSGKGAKERIVPIGKAAGRALDSYLASGRSTFTKGNLAETHVFVTRLGRAFTRQGIFKIIRERAAAVGIAADKVSPHVLRHCFASHMLAHGADIRVIQELLGHADIGTTQVYTHVDSAHFAEIHKLHPRH
ncbi:MAG: tyrosine recombinase [Kiritimatiellae bacterium]|nr:tyrosine recombinase [Kiritimatiellia bacterium]